MEYKILLEEITKLIPQRYYNNPVKRLDIEFSNVLYADIIKPAYGYLTLDGRYITPRSKGECYIPEMLYWINKHQEYDKLPPFLIYIFLTDFGRNLVDNHTLLETEKDDFKTSATTTLTKDGWPLANKRVKRIIPIYTNKNASGVSGDDVKKNYLNDVALPSEKMLAKAIVDIFDASLQDVDMVYWDYPDWQYDEVEKARTTAEELFGAIISGGGAIPADGGLPSHPRESIPQRSQEPEKIPHGDGMLTKAELEAIARLKALGRD